ncbi:hypothetical protein EVAR_38427_1 [Eumeta japonica]|uniref:Uncharacterized protein n=1 Tax=Eumeta variegata TaxID=151549 RepID=A0A4C1WY77_EUMVA|nr:hypothetical protein EVAR_38427_1 [Eumeta japonica]
MKTKAELGLESKARSISESTRREDRPRRLTCSAGTLPPLRTCKSICPTVARSLSFAHLFDIPLHEHTRTYEKAELR